MQKLVDVNLHGDLGIKTIRKCKLAVKSVAECIRALQVNSKGRLYRYLYEKDKEGIRYQVLINQRPFLSEEPLDINDLETVRNSELVAHVEDLKSIDIIPVIEGADSGTVATILGVLLIIIGAILLFTGVGAGFGFALIVAGLGLVAAGVSVLLSKPPDFEDFRQITGGKTSYLFQGPQNTTREGGPVPVGYGRLLVGSQVISASYETSDFPAKEQED